MTKNGIAFRPACRKSFKTINPIFARYFFKKLWFQGFSLDFPQAGSTNLGETPGLSGVHLDLRAGGGGVVSMFKSFRVAVVIPCYRVEATVSDVVAKIPEFVDWIIAVNDASPDGTLER
jgi:hypothetical protein